MKIANFQMKVEIFGWKLQFSNENGYFWMKVAIFKWKWTFLVEMDIFSAKNVIFDELKRN